MNLWNVVLAGGVGSRFWPLSTPERPKQLLPLISESPMLRDTLDRMRPLAPMSQTLVLTNASLRDAVLALEPELPPENVIAEPRPAGTCAALAWAAERKGFRAGAGTGLGGPFAGLLLRLLGGPTFDIGNDGVARRDLPEPARDVVKCLVPTDRLELARALVAHTPHRLEHARGMVGALGVARHLGAQHAIGVAMRRVAMHLDCHAVLHGGQQRTCVRAVMRAGAADLAVARRLCLMRNHHAMVAPAADCRAYLTLL